jgi:hypothetical protein
LPQRTANLRCLYFGNRASMNFATLPPAFSISVADGMPSRSDVSRSTSRISAEVRIFIVGKPLRVTNWIAESRYGTCKQGSNRAAMASTQRNSLRITSGSEFALRSVRRARATRLTCVIAPQFTLKLLLGSRLRNSTRNGLVDNRIYFSLRLGSGLGLLAAELVLFFAQPFLLLAELRLFR